jgi:hypothetical protein
VQRGNAGLRIAEAGTTLFGPVLGGLVIAGFGAAAAFGADAASYGLSALCLTMIRLPAAAAPAEQPAPVWRALAEGWREFRARNWLWSVIVLWALYGLLVFGPALPLTAVAIVAAHGTDVYAVVMSAFGAGTIVGGLLGLALRPARPLAAGSLAVAAFAGVPLVVAAGAPVPILIVGHALAGIGVALWSVLWATTLQTGVPAAVLSRVAAYDVAGSLLALPIGRALAGPAATAFGLRPLLVAGAVSGVVISAAMLATPAIRRLRRPAPDLAATGNPQAPG